VRGLHVSLPSAGAFGQVREGMRVDTGDKFGLRVAVKIISRRLIKKVRSTPPHSLQRAGAIRRPHASAARRVWPQRQCRQARQAAAARMIGNGGYGTHSN